MLGRTVGAVRREGSRERSGGKKANEKADSLLFLFSAFAYISHVALAACTSPQPAATLIAAKVYMLAVVLAQLSCEVWIACTQEKRTAYYQHCFLMADIISDYLAGHWPCNGISVAASITVQRTKCPHFHPH